LADLPTLNQRAISPQFESYWKTAFNLIAEGYDAWDYSWLYTIWENGGYALSPSVRLTTNIGFDQYGTHTQNYDKRLTEKGRKLPQKVSDQNLTYSHSNLLLDYLLELIVYKVEFETQQLIELRREIVKEKNQYLNKYLRSLRTKIYRSEMLRLIHAGVFKRILLRLFPSLAGIRGKIKNAGVLSVGKLYLSFYLKRILLRLFPSLAGIRNRIRGYIKVKFTSTKENQ